MRILLLLLVLIVNAKIITFDEIKKDVFKNSDKYKLTALDIKESEINRDLSYKKNLPNIHFNSGLYNLGNSSYIVPTTEQDILEKKLGMYRSSNISLSLNLFNGFRNKREILSSNLGIKNSIERKNISKREILYETTSLYILWQYEYKRKKILQELLSIKNKNLEIAKKKYKNGLLSREELSLFEISLDEFKNSIIRNHYKTKKIIIKINQILKQDFIKEIDVPDDVALFNGEDEKKRNWEKQPECKLAKILEHQAQLRIKNAKSYFLPGLDFNFNKTFGGTGPLIGRDGQSFYLTMYWTLFNGLKRTSYLKKANLNLDKMKLELDIEKDKFEHEYDLINSEGRMIDSLIIVNEINSDRYKELYNRAEKRFKEGIISTSDFFEYQRKYFSSILSLLNDNLRKQFNRLDLIR